MEIICSCPAEPIAIITINKYNMDAIPRGPNQPIKAMDDQLKLVPIRLMATGSMRMMVRLKTAYNHALPSQWLAAAGTNTRPSIRKTNNSSC